MVLRMLIQKAASLMSRDERGLETVEWALLLFAIVVVIGGVVFALGDQIAAIFEGVLGLLGG